MEKVTAARLREKYFVLTGGRDFDTDLPPVALKRGTFYQDAESLVDDWEDETVKLIVDDMYSYRRVKSKTFPHVRRVAKDLALSLYNTRLDRKRRRPFDESTVIFTQKEAQDVLAQYGSLSGNPLAHMFDDPNFHAAIVIPKTPIGVMRRNGINKYVVSDQFLAAYDPSDRTKRVLIECYSPLAWGLLKHGDLNEGYVDQLRPHVLEYLKKFLTAGKHDQE